MRPMPWYLRLVSLAGGLLLIYPGIVTDTIGLCLVGGMFLVQYFTLKGTAPMEQSA